MKRLCHRYARPGHPRPILESHDVARRFPLAAFLLLLVVATSGRVYSQMFILGNVSLTITTGMPNGQPLPAQDASARLLYFRPTVITKITVTTSCPNQHFSLAVFATGLTYGVAAPEVTMTNGMPETNFVTDIPARTSGLGLTLFTLRYTASATFAQGNSVDLGPDVHTVRYTLIAQ